MEVESVTTTFLVEGVFPGPGGGAVFYGKDEDGQEVTAALNYKWRYRLPQVDEVWKVEGNKNPRSKYPETIKAKKAVPVVPPLGDLTRRFLCEAGQFRGFGFGKAKLGKLEKALALEGVSVHEALNENRVDLIAAVLPIAMAEKLVEAWRESVKDFEIYEFLDKYGFDRSLAVPVQRVFKSNTIARLKENPYRLIAFGGSCEKMWKKAERAAEFLGINRRDPIRLAAAVEQAFYDRLADGHTLTDLETLKPMVMRLLKTKSKDIFELAVRSAAAHKAVVRCENGLQPLGPASMEAFVERRLVALANLDSSDCPKGLFSADNAHVETLLAEVNAEFLRVNGNGLNAQQLDAVRAICTSFLCVVSGGAGTGKTTILRAVHDIAERSGGTVFQIALSDPAKQKMEEATGRQAFAIHTFIENLKKGQTSHNGKASIIVEEGSFIIIDEASLVDLSLFHKLLRLLPERVRLSVVGDSELIRPSGFGLVFHRLVGFPGIRTIELTETVQHENSTSIQGLSKAVRKGSVPKLHDLDGTAAGVFFRAIEEESDIATELFAVSELLNHNCQVLNVRERFGSDSSNKINRYFQYRFADVQAGAHLARWKIFVGDPVIVTRNSYDLGVFKGTLGALSRIDGHYSVFLLGGSEVKLSDEQIVELGIKLAYGITVQNAQALEFDRVIVPVTKLTGLDRPLIYTALTRARKQVVFVGHWDTFRCAVQSQPTTSLVDVGFDMRETLATERIG